MKKNKRQISRELLLKFTLFLILAVVLGMLVKKNPYHSWIQSTDILTMPSEFLIPFDGLSQDKIPTGCESVSTTAVLQYYGIAIDTDIFIEEYLPCDTFYIKDKKLYGPDPNDFFLGDPYSTDSRGCYPGAILKALNTMKKGDYPNVSELTFKITTGTDFEKLIQDYIINEIPVIIWITRELEESYDGIQYYLKDGTIYTWKSPEHCVVLCGYDEENYLLMDPLEDGKIVEYPKELVEERYEEMGRNSLVIYR
ncbi:MAG: C39 family peptidase [Schaedlerella sp.]|nr:C39 family peptidase [Schaedlerella sp.]